MVGMQKKKLDSRIPTLIKNGVQTNHRSFFVLVGDRGRDQVVTLHFLLSKARVSARPSVLWCYKKDLGFSSHRKKRMNQIKRQIANGTRDADEDDPFELFVSSTSIRYTYYKETDKILGQTFGMCVLQDFEAMTPNLLARTIETVEGGGIVVLILKSMSSLKQLYSMTMDVHSRYRTESHQDTVARFNERFILSLGGCDTCLVLDDELNVLPLSVGKNVKPLPRTEDSELTETEQELVDLKKSLQDTQPVGSLVSQAKTLDQAKAVLTFIEAIAEKSLRSTVALTAARGRGKSAALGIAIASAIAYGYSNIFITSPSPENLKTLFEFVFKGFDALGYQEHLDYDILQSTNPAFQKAIVRINIFKDHRQTIQWIQPSDYHVLTQAELVVIDEAAAIPLTIVKKLLGPYLVFMASTINGYEGTGRALSLKLIQQLREQSRSVDALGAGSITGVSVGRDGKEVKDSNAPATGVRTLREIKLSEPIRYGLNDPVEAWLNKLLCLDCSSVENSASRLVAGCPHPSMCELYYVNRDTLFSYHPVSETFLQKIMSLYVASHYKNSPNDLQLLSDAPAHHLFVLLPPVDESKTNTLPEPLCVLQVCMEGTLAKNSALSSLARGIRSSGDMIPWVVTQQFQDDDFATLSGARVVRVATHPDYIGMGYGSRAIEQLEAYYSGNIQSLSETNDVVIEEMNRITEEELEQVSLQTDEIKVRDAARMPPLLMRLSERPLRESLHWLGVSYGLTNQLHKFWKRSGFSPVYLRQTANELTGEHTCIMLKSLNSGPGDVSVQKDAWLSEFCLDFKRRFLELLAYQFRAFSPLLVLNILEASSNASKRDNDRQGLEMAPLDTKDQVLRVFTPFDLKRLESYSHNLLDYHVILDLVSNISKAYFLGRLSRHGTMASSSNEATSVKLSAVQSAIMAGLGLQKKTVEELDKDLSLPVSQILALFGKAVRKSSLYLNGIVEKGFVEEVDVAQEESKKRKLASQTTEETTALVRDAEDEEAWDPLKQSLDDDLEEAGKGAVDSLKAKQREMIDNLNLSNYAIAGDEDDWASVKINGGSNLVSIKNKDSSKKRKGHSKDGTAADLASKVRGESTGVYDPKGLVKKKNKKSKKSGHKA